MIILEDYNSGHLEKGSGYKYFKPTNINNEWNWSDVEINHMLEKTAVKLGELNSFARLVPNIDLFILLHVTKESVVSNKIEGTKTNMDEALMPVEEIKPERRNDWKEVQNYTQSLNYAINQLKNLPISSRLIKNTHKLLLESVRGEMKSPGEYRKSQNWIGGNSIQNASFIPPHHEYVGPLMGDLENFLNNDKINVPYLIRIAIAHYQFETIHPFLDGNGRIGRLLITLYLVAIGILDKPLLYLSVYFEHNKELYYNNLTIVRNNNDMIGWIKYFLKGIESTADLAVDTLTKILHLKQDIENTIQNNFGRRSNSAMILMNFIFTNPFITVDKVKEFCNLSYKSANDLVGLFVKENILKEVTGQSRNRMFIFDKYVSLFRD